MILMEARRSDQMPSISIDCLFLFCSLNPSSFMLERIEVGLNEDKSLSLSRQSARRVTIECAISPTSTDWFVHSELLACFSRREGSAELAVSQYLIESTEGRDLFTVRIPLGGLARRWNNDRRRELEEQTEVKRVQEQFFVFVAPILSPLRS